MFDRPVFVEFLGLSGAGKSTVSHRVAEHLRSRGFPVCEPTLTLALTPGRGAVKSLHVARELMFHPLSSLRTLKAVKATRQRWPVLARMGFNWLMLSSLMRTQRPSLHLFDQGAFQALWSIGLEGRRGAVRHLGRRLLATVPAPELVVVIEAGARVVEQRLKLRGGRESRADLWDSAALRRSMRTMDEVKSILKAMSARPGGPRVVLVANDQNENAQAVADRLAMEIERLAEETLSLRRLWVLPKREPVALKVGVRTRVRKRREQAVAGGASRPSRRRRWPR
ncbi:MAG TPA: hypothetical protein VGR66_12550 [Candidatus Eisenbacteria bacterium]|nr:hypothetical protein [Candidatus Eisenbacteria bacterium]